MLLTPVVPLIPPIIPLIKGAKVGLIPEYEVWATPPKLYVFN